MLHSAEAADSSGADRTAEGVANYFALPSTQASTQLAVDRDSCVRMLPDLVIPWGAKGANSAGLHVELCGFAHWTDAEWLARPTLLDRGAYKVARWCYHYRIPVAYVNPAGLLAGRKGITTHADVNEAFQGGTHWDPGSGFPRAPFLRLVNGHLAAIVASRNG